MIRKKILHLWRISQKELGARLKTKSYLTTLRQHSALLPEPQLNRLSSKHPYYVKISIFITISIQLVMLHIDP